MILVGCISVQLVHMKPDCNGDDKVKVKIKVKDIVNLTKKLKKFLTAENIGNKNTKVETLRRIKL